MTLGEVKEKEESLFLLHLWDWRRRTIERVRGLVVESGVRVQSARVSHILFKMFV